MKNIIKLLLFAVIAVTAQSCGVSTHYGTLKPYESRYYSQMNDLVACGETTIEVEYSSYLFGVLHNVHTVNGVRYDGTNTKSISMPKGLHGIIGKAAYKVIEQYPDARYFQVVRVEKQSQRLFLGSVVKETAIIRAYKFK